MELTAPDVNAAQGYALMDCFAGCVLSVLLYKPICLEKNPARLLDSMAIDCCTAIAMES